MTGRFREAFVDEVAAAAIMEPYIGETLHAFVEYGLDKLARTKIIIRHAMKDEGRHFGMCADDASEIVLSPYLVQLPEATMRGIIAHELGHAADFAYPAQWGMSRSGKAQLLDVSRRGTRRGEEMPKDWLDDWLARDDDTVERMADAIAETVMGVTIGYGGPCMLQQIGGGVRPRPKGLR